MTLAAPVLDLVGSAPRWANLSLAYEGKRSPGRRDRPPAAPSGPQRGDGLT